MPEQTNIDVISDFVCDSRNEQYNRAYRLWRHSGPSRYLFRFLRRGGERVFIDGEGFIDLAPQTAMRTTMQHVSWLMGIVLTFVLLLEAGGGGVVLELLRVFFGIQVQGTFLTVPGIGNQWAIVAVRIAIALLCYLLPSVYLIRKLRLPRKVCLPLRVTGSAESLAGTALALLLGIVISRMAELSGEQYLSRQSFYAYQDVGAILVYAVFDIVVASMLSELFYRGVLLQMLRQFGDGYALCTIGIIAFLMPNTLPFRVGEAFIGVLCGYFLLRTGSLLTSCIIHIAYAASNFGQLLLLDTGFLSLNSRQINLLLLCVILLGLGLALVLYRYQGRRFKPLNRVGLLTAGEKLDATLGTSTLLPWFACAVLLTIIQLAT